MNKNLITRNKVNKFIFLILILFLSGAAFFEIAYLKSYFACAKIIDVSKVKGINYLNFCFVVNGKKHFSSVARYEINPNISTDSLKNVQCLQIEYSFISETINRVSDKRYLNSN